MVGAWRRPPACRGRLRGAPPRGRRSRNAGGLNLYAYAENDPLNRSDYLGLATLLATERITIRDTFLGIGPSIHFLLDFARDRSDRPFAAGTGITQFTLQFDVVRSKDPVDFVDPEGSAFPGKDQEPTPGDDVLASALPEDDEPFMTAEETASVGDIFLDGLQGAISAAGLIPVLGEAADLANAGISILRGRPGEAAIDAISAATGPGQATGAGLAGLRLGRAGKGIFGRIKGIFSRGSKAAKNADDLVISSRRPSRAGSDTSRAQQALQKKIDRGSTAFGTDKSQEAAERIIRDITENPSRTVTRPNGVDIFDAQGRGVRIKNGEFDTILAPDLP